MTALQTRVLGAQPFLRGLAVDQVAALAELCQHIAVPSGRRLFDEGSPADRFWLIDAGQAALDLIVPGRGRVRVDTLGRGDVVGLSALTPPYQWRFGAVATSRCRALSSMPALCALPARPIRRWGLS